jgi:diphosphomevalonate decarboxylase
MPADIFLLNKPIDKIVWRCPSNIAIVKYWGKKGIQIPCNTSVSFTLSESYSEIELEVFDKKSNSNIELEYFFEEKKNVPFENRVLKYLSDHLNWRGWEVVVHVAPCMADLFCGEKIK